MNIEVCIIGWNRPTCLTQTLNAVSNLSKSPCGIKVFLDGDNLSEQSVGCYDVACRYCGTEHVKLNSSREGIPAQWWKALCRTESEGVDAVLVLEDDVVVEPLYLDAIESMLHTYRDPRVSLVSSFPDKVNPCAPCLPWTTGDHLLGVATTKEQWLALKPYYQLFLDGKFPTLEGNCGPNPLAGQDVALYTAMAMNGSVPLFSRYRLAKYIGVHGVHGTLDDYEQKQWGTLPTDSSFIHEPMNQWWLDNAVRYVKEQYIHGLVI